MKSFQGIVTILKSQDKDTFNLMGKRITGDELLAGYCPMRPGRITFAAHSAFRSDRVCMQKVSSACINELAVKLQRSIVPSYYKSSLQV